MYLAVLGASHDHRGHGGVRWVRLILVTVAAVAARTFAMAANRIVDRKLGRPQSPYGAARARDRRKVSVRTAAVGSFGRPSTIFVVIAAILSPLCLVLAPVALAVFLL